MTWTLPAPSATNADKITEVRAELENGVDSGKVMVKQTTTYSSIHVPVAMLQKAGFDQSGRNYARSEPNTYD